MLHGYGYEYHIDYDQGYRYSDTTIFNMIHVSDDQLALLIVANMI